MDAISKRALDAIRAGDLFGDLGVRWNPALKVLTDTMGVPLSLSAVRAFMELGKEHLELTPAQLCELANEELKLQMPSWKDRELLKEDRFK